MARFHVYRLEPDDALVLDVQSSLLVNLDTRAVVPLLPTTALSPIMARLNPKFTIDGDLYVMATQFIGVVSDRSIGLSVSNLTARADDIIAALDFLFQGF
ncbi:hypothetical protein BJF93_03990 [Xaviernesmea oryzae]|uniref:Toxin CcdB n=1 Tax=Xaviernesmea oryzae TaxID=464029 RepID=A0A1Q9AUG4_9HYPH|nr:CcdB family protein [Xaviernesmea oryzae]OLP59090.1 hypothetical protein BJF93_03990 [Xaviernesmea oryzae]SEK87110.1 toxin CcdB [Xaviernesmea oryzae]